MQAAAEMTADELQLQIHAGLTQLRPLLPDFLRPYFDRYIEFIHVTETSIDRFISLMESFRYTPPNTFLEGLLRIRNSIRPIPVIDVASNVEEDLITNHLQHEREQDWERNGGRIRGPFTPGFVSNAVDPGRVVVKEEEGAGPIDVEPAVTPLPPHVELQRGGGTYSGSQPPVQSTMEANSDMVFKKPKELARRSAPVFSPLRAYRR